MRAARRPLPPPRRKTTARTTRPAGASLFRTVSLTLATLAGILSAGPAAAQSDGEDALGPGDQTGSAVEVRALIAARDRAVLSSELSAAIATIPVRPGEAFAEDDTLVRFDCAAFRAQRDVGQAEVDSAEAQLKVQKRLFELDSVGRLDVDLAEASLRRAEAQLRVYRVKASRCRVRAPYDGRVVDWRARPHASVETGDELIEIVGSGALEVEAIVPSRWLSWLETGARFSVAIEETRSRHAAEIVALGAVVDPVSQTVSVRGRLIEGLGALAPGMSGAARFEPPDAAGEGG